MKFIDNIIGKSLVILFWLSFIFLLLFSMKIYIRLFERKSINVYGWVRIINPEYIKRFEKQTGIKVFLSYYETNEELLVKLRGAKGKGYDLIFPSDNMVIKLQKENFIKKLDKSQLSFFDGLNSNLTKNYFDPKNEYSIPYYWGICGIAIDKSYFGTRLPVPSWDLIFNKKVTPGYVGMIDDSREVVNLAAKYLFKDIPKKGLNDLQIKEVKDLLIEQKEWVEAYTDFRVEDLLMTQNSPVVVAPHFEIFVVSKINKDIEFLIPKEGAFVIIDNVVIPKATEKEDLVYKFINFLYKEENFKYNFEKYGLLPPMGDFSKWNSSKTNLISKITSFNRPENFKKLSFFKDIIPESKLNDLWIELKSK